MASYSFDIIKFIMAETAKHREGSRAILCAPQGLGHPFTFEVTL